MRNRLCYILIGILFSFSFINGVYADTKVTLNTAETNVSEGTGVSIKVNVKSDVSLSSCLFQISKDDGIIFDSSAKSGGWEIDENGSSSGTLVKSSSTSMDLSNGVNVLELKYTIDGSGIVKVKTLNCVNATTGEKITEIGDASITFTATKNTKLNRLHVGGGTLLSTFSSDEYEYNVRLSSPSFSISYTTSNANLNNKVVVKHGDNVIKKLDNISFSGDNQGTMIVTVTVDNTTTYTLFLRYQKTGLDNTLKSVKINGKEIVLEKGKFDYEYTVGNDITSFIVEAELNDKDNFKFNSIGGNIPDSGKQEFNIYDVVDVLIVIDPKDSSTGIAQLDYIITVKKSGASKPKPKPNVDSNPGTGGLSMYMMLVVLFGSLIGSIVLYKKNLDGYK